MISEKRKRNGTNRRTLGKTTPTSKIYYVGNPLCKKHNYYSERTNSLIDSSSDENFSADHSESMDTKALYKLRSSL